MKVVYLQECQKRYAVGMPGEVRELPDSLAAELIRAGIVREAAGGETAGPKPLETAEAPAAPETATTRKGRAARK